MNRYRFLLKNVGLLTIGNFASKILSFLLVPLYTAILSSEEYGSFDFIVTTISLLLPIFSANIIEAVLRFPLEKKDDREYVSNVYTIGVRYTVISCAFLLVFIIINHLTNFIPTLIKFERYFFILYFVQAFNNLLLNFARATYHVKAVSVAGVLMTAVMIILNLFFLLGFRLGLTGYFWASIISHAVAVVYYVIKLKAFSYTRIKLSEHKLAHEMVVYSFPMVFNTIGWWINNASDRYVVTWLCGIAANGVYSVAYKVPSILNVFHTIFTQAWILSAVQEYKKEGNTSFFRNVYNTYGCLMTVICSALIILTKPIAFILFKKEFYLAWQYTSWLLIAVVFGTLSGVLGGIFSAEKDSKLLAISTCVGAALNIVLNIILVKLLGPLGAAIATAFSAYVVWIVRIKHTKKYINLELRILRDHVVYGLIIVQGILLLLINKMLIYYIICCGIFIIILVLYRTELLKILRKAKESFFNVRNK